MSLLSRLFCNKPSPQPACVNAETAIKGLSDVAKLQARTIEELRRENADLKEANAHLKPHRSDVGRLDFKMDAKHSFGEALGHYRVTLVTAQGEMVDVRFTEATFKKLKESAEKAKASGDF